MSEKLINGFLASIIGSVSAIGMVWFLSDENTPAPPPFVAPTEMIQSNIVRARQIEAEQIRLHGSLVIVDAQTGQTLLEMRNGILWAQHGVFSEKIGACSLVGQKYQLTRDNPGNEHCGTHGELGVNDEGGSYFSLLSAHGTHSINLGFDTKETGYIVSQNNEDRSVRAQVILPLPQDPQRAITAAGNIPLQSAELPRGTRQ